MKQIKKGRVFVNSLQASQILDNFIDFNCRIGFIHKSEFIFFRKQINNLRLNKKDHITQLHITQSFRTSKYFASQQDYVMTNSISDKITKQFQKLTHVIMQAQNYLQLQNAIDQFNSIKKTLFNQHSSHNKHYQTGPLLNTTEQLIKEKIKYFKKRALDKLNSPTNYQTQNNSIPSATKIKYDRYSPLEKDNKYNSKSHMTIQKQSNKKSKKEKERQKQRQNFTWQDDFIESQRKRKVKRLQSPDNNNSFRRLKQSKSVQNLFGKNTTQHSFTLRGDENTMLTNKQKALEASHRQYKDSHLEKHNNNKRRVQKDDRSFIDFDDQKTQVRMHDQSIQAAQTQNMLKIMQWLQHRSGGDINLVQIKRKLGQKVLQLQQLRGRLRYYENENSELKKRVYNEQRRQEDYIASLKGKIKVMDGQLYQHDKERKLMTQLIKEMEFKMEAQEKQIHAYGQKLEEALMAKQHSKEQSAVQTLNLKKQLQLLSKHQSSLQDLETLLNQQKNSNSILNEKNQLQAKQLKQLNQHLTILTNDKTQLQELLEIKLQEIQSYQQEIYQLKTQLSQENEENTNLQTQLQALNQREKQLQRRKENNLKKKMQKLKSVKSLLQQQV